MTRNLLFNSMHSFILRIVGLLFFYLFTSSISYSQNDIINYGRMVVDTLTSPYMHGRGYVNKGDSIAASFIKNEFEKFGLMPIEQNFYQAFNFPVNTFPNKLEINIDGKRLEPGKDFILYSSPSSRGNYPIEVANDLLTLNKKYFKKFTKQNFRQKVLLVNDTGEVSKQLQDLPKNIKPKALILLKDKLTQSVETYIPEYPTIEILRTAIENPKKINFSIENKFIANYQSQNIIGYIKGNQYPDSFIVFSAHYDHLGQLGKKNYFPGANDNASGCAMLLSLAKYYAKHQPKYSVTFIAFGGEELGLLGSKYYVEHPLFSLTKIKFLVNMDIMGTGDEGIKVVSATENKNEFDQLVKINSEKKLLTSVQPRGKASISDHYFFEEAGVKTFFIYTLGGIKAYHDIYDRSETLPLTKFAEVYNLLLNFTDYLQQ